MDKKKLQEILDKHLKWARGEVGGERANLSDANLSDANLRGANLSRANLSRATLGDANLSDANLSGANNIEDALSLFYPIACPSEGAFVGWKKAWAMGRNEHCIVKLRILDDARRSSASGRKCRCDKAEVLEIQSIGGDKLSNDAESDKDPDFIYSVGEIVSADNFCENRWEECAAGIHFYITREEAVRHYL